MAINPKNFSQQMDCNGRGIPGVHDSNWVVTSNATGTTCVASRAAASGQVHVITGVVVYADAVGATVRVAQGTDTRLISGLSVAPLALAFASPIILSANTTANCTVSGATGACYANMTGFTITQKT